MKKTLLLVLFLFSSAAQAGWFKEAPAYPFGEPIALSGDPTCLTQVYQERLPVIVNDKLAKRTLLGCFDAFTVLHSGLTRTPLWAAEHLTRERIEQAAKLDRKDSFHAEERVPLEERAALVDYARSGYDRGHLAPNKDMPDRAAQHQSFSLANIVPQDPDNNQVLWSGIESAVRTLSRTRGELYVVTGPLFVAGEDGKLDSLKGRVLVPSGLFKAVLDPKTGQAAAYLVKNQPGREYQVLNMNQLARLTGFDIFPTLDKKQRERLLDLPRPLLKVY